MQSAWNVSRFRLAFHRVLEPRAPSATGSGTGERRCGCGGFQQILGSAGPLCLALRTWAAFAVPASEAKQAQAKQAAASVRKRTPTLNVVIEEYSRAARGKVPRIILC